MSNLKKLVIYGDSISTINHGEGGYEAILKKSLHLDEIYNYAVGSSGLSTVTPNNMVDIVSKEDNIPADADLILIWHGSNDWYWGTPIGGMGESNPDTFWGGIDYVISRLRKRLPMAKLVWVTPIYRYEAPYELSFAGEAYELSNCAERTMQDYYDTLEKASVRYGFPLIDMRRRCNIHQGNEDYYLEDRVHPNKNGYDVIGKVLVQEIEGMSI